jgi:hypothetical protein
MGRDDEDAFIGQEPERVETSRKPLAENERSEKREE